MFREWWPNGNFSRALWSSLFESTALPRFFLALPRFTWAHQRYVPTIAENPYTIVRSRTSHKQMFYCEAGKAPNWFYRHFQFQRARTLRRVLRVTFPTAIGTVLFPRPMKSTDASPSSVTDSLPLQSSKVSYANTTGYLKHAPSRTAWLWYRPVWSPFQLAPTFCRQSCPVTSNVSEIWTFAIFKTPASLSCPFQLGDKLCPFHDTLVVTWHLTSFAVKINLVPMCSNTFWPVWGGLFWPINRVKRPVLGIQADLDTLTPAGKHFLVRRVKHPSEHEPCCMSYFLSSQYILWAIHSYSCSILPDYHSHADSAYS